MTATVLEELPNALYRVELESRRQVLAHSGETIDRLTAERDTARQDLATAMAEGEAGSGAHHARLPQRVAHAGNRFHGQDGVAD